MTLAVSYSLLAVLDDVLDSEQIATAITHSVFPCGVPLPALAALDAFF